MEGNVAVLEETETTSSTDELSFDNWYQQVVDFTPPTRGEIRDGTLVDVTEYGIRVDVGGKSEGVLASKELERMSKDDLAELEVGEQLQVYVVNPLDRDGNTIVSLTKAAEEMDWRRMASICDTDELVEGEVVGYNKGGLLIQISHLRGFVPGSLVDNQGRDIGNGSTPEERWGSMRGELIKAKVIEVERSRNRLVLSERGAMREYRKLAQEKLLQELREGEIRTGRVASLARFGAFVDLGGADGLVHLSELSWKHVTHPREVLSVGDEVEVYVLNVDRERRRIGLSLKRLEPDPWWSIEEKCHEGMLLEAIITRLTNFGAFARVDSLGGVEGLVHISELSEEHIEHPREIVAEGELVTLRVLRVDAQQRRLGLSLSQVSSDEYMEQDWIGAKLDTSESE
jgi:small subunit ribosomal protein S1